MIAAPALTLALAFMIPPAELAARPAGTLTVLDARSASDYRAGHIPGAVRIDWTDFRDGWGRTGRLPGNLDDLALRLATFGVDSERPVVVYGDAHRGWGEEGRIVWMLAYLGHPDARLLDGGWSAWLESRQAVSTAPGRPLSAHFIACTAGVRSAEAWTILRALGYADVRNYDGSWFEWSADDRRPVSRE